MQKKPNTSADATGLRRRAEARMRERLKHRQGEIGDPKAKADSQRLLHELEVHQIELELQNAELQQARDRMEALLEKYTDLYDFAPVGYFTLDGQGRILEVNLMGAALLGVERSRLLNRCLPRFVAPTSQPVFLTFLERVFAGSERQVCEAALLKENGAHFWANCHAVSVMSLSDPSKSCRVAVSDVTVLKRAEKAQRDLEVVVATNRALKREIARRQAVEASLRNSQQHQSLLLTQSRQMQEQLRHLSHQILLAQEDERKKISRELHDVIAQVLMGINVRLATLKTEAAVNSKGLTQRITRTQRLVEKSMDIVHRFARELRPAVLDDLGLIPALRSFVKHFKEETGIRVRLTAFAGLSKLDATKRTVLYRVVQEALTNAARHAQASRVDVTLRKLRNAVGMEINDNGKSFDVERVLHARKNRRLGVLGMRERVEMVGGRFMVESAPGHGTTIRAQIPFGGSRARRRGSLTEPAKAQP